MIYVYYMTGTPEGSTESGFMEKPGIEPATPGLQGIALIHYTTEASDRQGKQFTIPRRLHKKHLTDKWYIILFITMIFQIYMS